MSEERPNWGRNDELVALLKEFLARQDEAETSGAATERRIDSESRRTLAEEGEELKREAEQLTAEAEALGEEARERERQVEQHARTAGWYASAQSTQDAQTEFWNAASRSQHATEAAADATEALRDAKEASNDYYLAKKEERSETYTTRSGDTISDRATRRQLRIHRRKGRDSRRGHRAEPAVREVAGAKGKASETAEDSSGSEVQKKAKDSAK